MYSFNGKNLADYGLVPVRTEGNPFALQGIFDMPKRKEPTHYSWDNEEGVEPYVLPGQIRHEGRDLTLTCLFYGSRAEVKALQKHIQDTWGEVKNGVLFSSTLDMLFNCYIKQVDISCHNGFAELVFRFREPAVDIPTASTTDIADTGKWLALNGRFDVPALKAVAVNQWSYEKSQVGKREGNKIELELLVTGNLKAAIYSLMGMLAAPGLREVYSHLEGVTYKVFNTDGFTAEVINADTAQVSIPLMCAI